MEKILIELISGKIAVIDWKEHFVIPFEQEQRYLTLLQKKLDEEERNEFNILGEFPVAVTAVVTCLNILTLPQDEKQPLPLSGQDLQKITDEIEVLKNQYKGRETTLYQAIDLPF